MTSPRACESSHATPAIQRAQGVRTNIQYNGRARRRRRIREPRGKRPNRAPSPPFRMNRVNVQARPLE